MSQSSADSLAVVDWRVFTLPVERTSRRNFPEHLIASIRHHSSDVRYQKQGFWEALLSTRWATADRPAELRRRQRTSAWAFHGDELCPTRTHDAFHQTRELIPSSHVFYEEVVRPAVERKSSVETRVVPYSKIPGWVETRMLDVESQFFLRNIARYEIPLVPVPFEEQTIRHADWSDILEASRKYQRHQPELLMEWSTYFMAEMRHEFRRILHFADWDDFFGVISTGQLEKRRADALSRFYEMDF